MAKMGISARGVSVNFDILQIKQQLASKPVSIGVDERRKFIDVKNGIKLKEEVKNGLQVIPDEEIDNSSGMLDVAYAAVEESLISKKGE
jgi:hypothetical protein